MILVRHFIRSGFVAGVLIVCLVFPLISLAGPRLEGASDERWKRFYGQWNQVKAGKASRPLRILQLGDSHTAADYFTGHLRSELQKNGGNGGPGFLPPGKVKGYRYEQVVYGPGTQWEVSRDRGFEHQQLLGLGGFLAGGAQPFQLLKLNTGKTSLRSILTLYVRHQLSVPSELHTYQNGHRITPLYVTEIVRTSNIRVERQVYTLEPGVESMGLLLGRALPENALLGMYWESRGAGVVVSQLGFNGAKFSEIENWQGPVVQSQIMDMEPDLVLLAFGSNDAFDLDFSVQEFSTRLKRVDEWLKRYAPSAAVLAILPPEALVRRGNCQSYRGGSAALPCRLGGANVADKLEACHRRPQPNLDPLRQALRTFASQAIWRVWDWAVLMGDACGVARWRQHGELLYQPDGVHLTPAGYRLSAQALLDALHLD